jgi:hypothetical protein
MTDLAKISLPSTREAQRTTALPGIEVALPLVSRIYLGAAKPGGGWVGRDEFQAFLESIVTRAFPNGFTLLNAQGVWKDTDNGALVHETTRIIEAAHDYGDLETVKTVAQAYKDLFEQQAVMVSTTVASVSFV